MQCGRGSEFKGWLPCFSSWEVLRQTLKSTERLAAKINLREGSGRNTSPGLAPLPKVLELPHLKFPTQLIQDSDLTPWLSVQAGTRTPASPLPANTTPGQVNRTSCLLSCPVALTAPSSGSYKDARKQRTLSSLQAAREPFHTLFPHAGRVSSSFPSWECLQTRRPHTSHQSRPRGAAEKTRRLRLLVQHRGPAGLAAAGGTGVPGPLQCLRPQGDTHHTSSGLSAIRTM